MTSPPERLIPYWLRTVRVGVRVTWITLLVLVIFPLVPGHGTIAAGPYLGLLSAAAAGVCVVSLLPWRRLFERGLGMWAMYAWSGMDILLIGGAIGVTGGGRSELFLLYALTTVFFGSYPLRGQLALLGFTVACYVTVIAVAGWEIGGAVLFLRMAAVATLAMLASFLSAALMHEMESHDNARSRSERWAAFLSTVAEASRKMTLDQALVVDVLVDSSIQLGFEAAGVGVFDEESGTLMVVKHRGLPEAYANAVHPASAYLPGLVRARGRTVLTAELGQTAFGGEEAAQVEGFHPLIATPVWLDGWLAAVVVAGGSQPRDLSPQEVEGFELLAAQAGLALQNARRFEETLRHLSRLEELDRLKSDFLATTSHELRTPLTVILGGGLTLEQRWRELDDSTRLELLTSVNANAKILQGLISSLLDFARLGADAPTPDLQSCFVPDVLRGAAERLAPLLAGHQLSVACQPGLVARADPSMIDRVLDNLLANAAKHTPAGTNVELSAHLEGDRVIITVADDGPGIPEEELRHLGERFYRGGDLNARGTKGLGLGLAWATEILQLHGSDLEMSSQLGSGARFSFALMAWPSNGPGRRDDLQPSISRS